MGRLSNVEVGKLIKAGRKKKGMTQVRLSFELNKDERTLRRYESGEVELPKKVAIEMSKIFDIPVMLLMGFEE